METSPIALFVYNRLEHTEKTIISLKSNVLSEKSELYIFSDSHKISDNYDETEENMNKVKKVREYIRKVSGFKKITIIERDRNFGLANSIISGVSEIVDKFGKIIVLEDDMITSKYFLEYMNEGLRKYEDIEDVISIHGYIYPVKKILPETFFLRGADCWGWATWKRGWDLFNPDGKKLLAELQKNKLIKEFDFYGSYDYSGMLKRQVDGKNNSWAIRWYASAFLNNKLTLYPGKSLVNNIGNDATGTHCGANKKYNSRLIDIKTILKDINIKEDVHAKKIIANYMKTNIFKKIALKFLKMIKYIIRR